MVGGPPEFRGSWSSPTPIGDLPQEGVNVGGEGACGPLRQPQRGPGVQALPPDRLQRRVDRKAPEAHLPVRADVGVDPSAGVAPNAGFAVRSHRCSGALTFVLRTPSTTQPLPCKNRSNPLSTSMPRNIQHPVRPRYPRIVFARASNATGQGEHQQTRFRRTWAGFRGNRHRCLAGPDRYGGCLNPCKVPFWTNSTCPSLQRQSAGFAPVARSLSVTSRPFRPCQARRSNFPIKRSASLRRTVLS